MKNILSRYSSGCIIFKSGDNLKKVSDNVPEKHGVYLVYIVFSNKKDLVYIGKSGTINQSGKFKSQHLKQRINNKQNNMPRQKFFDLKLLERSVDLIEIEWYITIENNNNDLPAFVEATLLQDYYLKYGKLPLWNKNF